MRLVLLLLLSCTTIIAVHIQGVFDMVTVSAGRKLVLVVCLCVSDVCVPCLAKLPLLIPSVIAWVLHTYNMHNLCWMWYILNVPITNNMLNMWYDMCICRCMRMRTTTVPRMWKCRTSMPQASEMRPVTRKLSTHSTTTGRCVYSLAMTRRSCSRRL